MWNLNVQNEVEIRRACCFLCAGFLYNMYPPLMGSKTPTSKFSESKEVRWGSTAHKSPIGEG